MGMKSGRTSAKDEAYAVLREGILTMELSPGMVISPEETARRLKMSRTPVREAFLRLHEEGLLVILPQRETIVARIDPARMRQERFIRKSLELPVLEQIIGRCRETDFEKMISCIQEQEDCVKESRHISFIHCDMHLHRLFFEIAGQELAWEMLRRVNGHSERFRALYLQDQSALQKASARNRTLLCLIEEEKKGQALEHVREQIERPCPDEASLIRRYPSCFA